MLGLMALGEVTAEVRAGVSCGGKPGLCGGVSGQGDPLSWGAGGTVAALGRSATSLVEQVAEGPATGASWRVAAAWGSVRRGRAGRGRVRVHLPTWLSQSLASCLHGTRTSAGSRAKHTPVVPMRGVKGFVLDVCVLELAGVP